MATTTDAQVGDKIELLYAGTVERIHPDGFIYTTDGAFSPSNPALVSIRVVERAKKQFRVGDTVKNSDYADLPPGSVVGQSGQHIVKLNRNQWLEVGLPASYALRDQDLKDPRTIAFLPE